MQHSMCKCIHFNLPHKCILPRSIIWTGKPCNSCQPTVPAIPCTLTHLHLLNICTGVCRLNMQQQGPMQAAALQPYQMLCWQGYCPSCLNSSACMLQRSAQHGGRPHIQPQQRSPTNHSTQSSLIHSAATLQALDPISPVHILHRTGRTADGMN